VVLLSRCLKRRAIVNILLLRYDSLDLLNIKVFRGEVTTYNFYCDESRHTSDPSQHYIVIGALQCPREEKHRIVGRLHGLMTKYGIKTEFDWKSYRLTRLTFIKVWHVGVISSFCQKVCSANWGQDYKENRWPGYSNLGNRIRRRNFDFCL
jgi:hypothetical protein